MLSEQAKEIIGFLKGHWSERMVQDPDMDPRLAALMAIYEERSRDDEPFNTMPFPDRLAVVPELADGVYGEWLTYLDELPDKNNDKVILFLHGGAFQTGSCKSRREMAAKIGLRAKMDTFIINYRLAPENPYPAGLMDCVTSFIWLLKKGYNPKNITVVGESAGAALAICMCHYMRDHYLPLPGKICPFSAPADLGEYTSSRIYNLPNDALLGREISQEDIEKGLEELKNGTYKKDISFYCKEEETSSPYVSPIRGDFYDFPKTLLEVGEKELLYEDSLLLYEKMKEQGADVKLHVWEDLFHVFALLPMPESDEVCMEIAEFAAE